MALMEELQDKLLSTEERVVSVLEGIQEFDDLKKSLDSTDKNLLSSSEQLGSLSSSLAQNAEAMRTTIESLRETIEVIKRTDPALIVAAQNRFESKLDSLDDNLSSAVSNSSRDTLKKLEACSRDTLEKLEDSKSNLDTAVAGLKKQLEETKQSTDMEFKRGKIFQQWTILLLVLNLGAFGYLFKQLF